MTDLYVSANGIRLHAIDHGGTGPTLLLAHGLTANAHAFDGLMTAGLTRYCRVWTVDLRGRGQSDAPPAGYTMAETARDIAQLIDVLQLGPLIMGGHSYGAFLSWYLAAHYPQQVQAVVALDAAMRMHPDTLQMLGPSLSRLGQVFESFEAYLDKVKAAPYLHFWDEAMTSYYRADVTTLPYGRVQPIPHPQHMTEAAQKVLAEPWLQLLQQVAQPVLMVNAPGIYTMGNALLPEALARETAALLPQVHFEKVEGNHQTMLYGNGAVQIVAAIADFLATLPVAAGA